MQIQPRNYYHVLDFAEYTTPTRQHQLLIDHADQEYIYISALKCLDHVVEIDYVSDVCDVVRLSKEQKWWSTL